MKIVRIRGFNGLTATALVVLGITGCESPKHAAPPPPSAAPVLAKAELALQPAAETAELPISAEVGIMVAHGTVKTVSLSDDKGQAVSGRLRGDSSGWVPDQPLAFRTRYTATVVATGEDGKDVTQSTSFTTMADPANRVDTGLYLFDGNEYGIAMPVVVEFMKPVDDDYRAAVQKRLFVTTDPPQQGAWSWASGQHVEYRAEHYWQPGTKITVRAALDGQPVGSGRYGDTDRRASATIAGSTVELLIDNATKRLTVQQDGVPTRVIPVSLGKPGTPSSSGTMVIMTKDVRTVFDTTNEPGVDHYRADISYAMRITWGGEFIHAAPWSVGDQGVRNVSHGCVNMSMDNAQWLFGVTHIGDPVTVRGTEQELVNGNGFTAWNQSWSEFLKGSALPVR
jgi:lipoprotein-anchoring transpeptidase ErfK/SrfK